MTDFSGGKTLVDEKERVSLGKSDDGALVSAPLEPRYREVAKLGEGGMGEIHVVRDAVIGRDVALKRVRGRLGSDPIARERFLREARVQGQLEHPSIVPVYDLAMTPDHGIFFTMRRVRGRTLDEYASGDVKLRRHALLSAMSRVCLAVDFAHARGVVHRDIKPANIMIGDYGEVYVLDWGLAKLVSSSGPPSGACETAPVSDSAGSGKTTVGSVLGTPGYMPPEQALGGEIDERADVFALGACLFEVLAGEPLVDNGPMQAMIAATLAKPNARISERAPERDVPVELEAICVRATAASPDDRFPTARAMSEAIERFLEGDRDLERRNARAREHAAAALSLLESAFASGEGATESRKSAMREVGRALENDPRNEDARRVLVRLLTEPPAAVPPEVQTEIAEDRERAAGVARRLAALALVSTVASTTVILVWLGLREIGWFVFGTTTIIAGALIAIVPPKRFVELRRYLVAGVSAAGLVATARVASPLVVLPLLAMGLGVGLLLFPRKTAAAFGMLASLACLFAPFVLEWTGLVSSSFHVEGDRLIIDAHLVHFREVPLLVWFFAATVVPIVTMCIYLANIRDRLSDAEQRIRLQAWQLRQILP